jgi:hypothetical protein
MGRRRESITVRWLSGKACSSLSQEWYGNKNIDEDVKMLTIVA